MSILNNGLRLPQSLHRILLSFSVSVFGKVPLNKLLTTTLSENYDSEYLNKLTLCDL